MCCEVQSVSSLLLICSTGLTSSFEGISSKVGGSMLGFRGFVFNRSGFTTTQHKLVYILATSLTITYIAFAHLP